MASTGEPRNSGQTTEREQSKRLRALPSVYLKLIQLPINRGNDDSRGSRPSEF